MPSVFPTVTLRTQQCFVSNGVKIPPLLHVILFGKDVVYVDFMYIIG